MGPDGSEAGPAGSTGEPAAAQRPQRLRLALLVGVLVALPLGWFSARDPTFTAILGWSGYARFPAWAWPVFPALGIVWLWALAGTRLGAGVIFGGWLAAWLLGRVLVGAALEVLRALPRMWFYHLPDFQWRHAWALATVVLTVGSASLVAWLERRRDLRQWLRVSLWERREVAYDVEERAIAAPVLGALRAGFTFAASGGWWVLVAIAATGTQRQPGGVGWVAALGTAGVVGCALSGITRAQWRLLTASLSLGLGMAAAGPITLNGMLGDTEPEETVILARMVCVGGAAVVALRLAGSGLRAAVVGGLGFALAAALTAWLLWWLHGTPDYLRVWLDTVLLLAAGGSAVGLMAGFEQERAEQAATPPAAPQARALGSHTGLSAFPGRGR